MDERQNSLLRKYTEAVLSAPAHLHLTSDRDPELFWNRHILDAVAILDTVPPFYKEGNERVLDVGSGNGIPGIPFSILMPSWTVDLVDSDNKKCGFIEAFCTSNAINNAHTVVGRAEYLAHTKMRSSYNIVVARALSKIKVTVELCSAFLKMGGILIVPHGTTWEMELGRNADSLDLLGLDMPEPVRYTLGTIEFTSVMFRKVADTPAAYPRSIGVPSKKPL
jgi:16S rRNA (guanine527-N7)-methyltransferase